MREIKVMTIKEFYLESYPSDELGVEINENATFVGLLNTLHTKCDVYQYIDVYDSVVRERLFSELAYQQQVSYNIIYDLWLQS
jgi:hypothetical protein